MAEVTIKGFIVGRLLELAREKLNEDEFISLEAELGVSCQALKTSYFKDYPVELQLRVQERIAPIVWGRDYDDEAARSFGHLNFVTFSQSAIGRTTLALVGKDAKRIVKASIRLISTVLTGMHIAVEERGERDMSVRFRNVPHPPAEWRGVIEGALEHAGVEPEVGVVVHGPRDIEYTVRWE